MREDKDVEAKLAAKDFIAYALEMKNFKESGEKMNDALRERMNDFSERMLSLDASQLKTLISEFRASTEMDDESRNGMISFAMMTLANDHPEAALALFTENQDLLGDSPRGNYILSSSLASWTSRDPDGALEWVRKNAKTHPDLITDDVKIGLVKGASTNGMALGFDLLKELKFENPDDALYTMAWTTNTSEKRTEFLGLLRDYSESNTDFEGASAVFETLADGIGKEGFEAGSKWIADNSLSAKELNRLATSISNSSKSEEKGQWIEWMGANVSAQSRENSIENTMRNWTQADYRAAGEWLASTPAGETKNTAVKSYAGTIARYDPETATQWALTLPQGKQQMSTLTVIHSQMPKKTPEEKAARAAFKEQYKIE